MATWATFVAGGGITSNYFVRSGKTWVKGLRKFLRSFEKKSAREQVHENTLKPQLESAVFKAQQFNGSKSSNWYRNMVTNAISSCKREYPLVARQLHKIAKAGTLAFVGVGISKADEMFDCDIRQHGRICDEIKDAVHESRNEKDNNYSVLQHVKANLHHYKIGAMIAKGCNAVVYEASAQELIDKTTGLSKSETETGNDEQLAIKMMFNYDVESNANVIAKAWEKETVPLITFYPKMDPWDKKKRLRRRKLLTSHPHIVDIKYAFVDDVPLLPAAADAYPCALPRRLYSLGLGRNKTQFLLMKRYNCTLRHYLKEGMVSNSMALILFAQLMEALACLEEAGVAHRDLKTDNILLDTSVSPPLLVVADFGCALAPPDGNLVQPFNNSDINLGGNPCLMAPEIAGVRAGFLSQLDYRKSDAWAAGAIAYELLGQRNPFYQLGWSSTTYNENHLPPFAGVDPYFARIIRNLLMRDRFIRISARSAANQLQMLLSAPFQWRNRPPTPFELSDWLVGLAAKTLCQNASGLISAENGLNNAFLARLDFKEVYEDAHLLFG